MTLADVETSSNIKMLSLNFIVKFFVMSLVSQNVLPNNSFASREKTRGKDIFFTAGVFRIWKAKLSG